MAGRTDVITDACWEDVWTICYTLVDDAYRVSRGRRPSASGVECSAQD